MTINHVTNSFNNLPISRQGLGYAPNNRPDATIDEKIQEASQQQEIQKLKNRDREVKSHEQAHLNAAGGLALGAAHFSYITGPDGQRYASGGDVSIDVSEVANDPQATLRKAETIRRAAMAPAQPSAQDYSVAAKAAAMASKAAMELLKNTGETDQTGGRINIKA